MNQNVNPTMKRLKQIGLTGLLSLSLFGGTFAHAEATDAITLKYDAFKDANWMLNGEAAQLRGGSNDGFVQLTTSQAYVAGSMFYKKPIPFGSDRSFSVYFATKMTNAGNGGADGVVFVISNKTDHLGKDGGGIGYLDFKDSIGVELDTWNNFAALGDPDGNHMAVNLNGDLSKPVGATTAGALAKKGVTLDDGAIKHVWIDYNGSKQTMEIRISKDATRPEGSDLTIPKLDLNTVLPKEPLYVGFTSATGGAFANHYISMFYMDTHYRPTGLSPTMQVVQNEKPLIASKSYLVDEDGNAIVDSLEASDPDQNPLTYKLLEDPKNGKLEWNDKTGAFSYKPNLNFFGMDQFKVVAFDGISYSSPGVQTIQVNPINDLPTVEPMDLVSELGQPVEALLKAQDPDGDSLRYLLDSFPKKGVVSIDDKTGALRYVPNLGQSGMDSFFVKVDDGKGKSPAAEIKVFITAVPKADSQQVQGDKGIPVNGQLIGSSQSSEPAKLTYVITKQPMNGKVELTTDGLYRYSPNPDFTGVDRFEFAIDDGKTLSNPAVVEIKINAKQEEVVKAVIVRHQAYMTGYPDGEFKSLKALTRGELAAAIVRLSSLKAISTKKTAFKDVKGSNWMYSSANIAHQNGLIKADAKLQFLPNQGVTRGELRSLIQRLRSQKRVEVEQIITAQKAVKWLTDKGTQAQVTNLQKVSRQEAVLILNRLYSRGPLTGSIKEVWLDVRSDQSDYSEIMEASVSHESQLVNDHEELLRQLK